jgi:predicted membrane chloride channel (bestrophin family)
VKLFAHFVIRSLPMVAGIILTLTALAFLIAFTDNASFDRLEDEEFWGFVLFALGGLPLTLFGINLLSNEKTP